MDRKELIKELQKHKSCEDVFLELCDKKGNVVYTKINMIYNNMEDTLLIQTDTEFTEITE